jgi:hypothetical protein
MAMPDDPRLIETLRRARATPPAAPAGEWFTVARRTVNARPRRSRGLAWGLGFGAAAAGLVLALPLLRPVAPPLPAEAALNPAEELDQALEPLKASAAVPEDENATMPGGEMLELLDAV